MTFSNVIQFCVYFLFFITLLFEVAAAETLKPFKTDGCSLFPDGSFAKSDAWCECCIQHDIAYWQGGTLEQKQQADLELKKCVMRLTGNTVLAETMYQGVKYGGHPIFPNWYRWGYGWDYGRGFSALTSDEVKQVNMQLKFVDATCPKGWGDD